MSVVRSSLQRARSVLALGLVFALFAGIAPAYSTTAEEVEQARREQEQAAAERAAALGDVAEAIEAYEEINAEYQTLVFQIGRVRSRIDSYQEEVQRLADRVRRRAADAYMRGIEHDPTPAMFSSSGVERSILAQGVLSKALADHVATLDSLEVITREMERLREQLTADSERATDLKIEAEAVAARMYELLAVAESQLIVSQENLVTVEVARVETLRQEELERIRREEERRRAELARIALLGPAGGVANEALPGFICPVAGVTAFTDTWGAPRSGGRVHVGVDMMGPRGMPLVAVADGTIDIGYGTLGGKVVYVNADYGARFFYAHLDSYPEGLVDGQWVTRGTVIGYMGDTGNPAPGAYHLHFSIYPTGSGAVNPYPTVAHHCPRP